MWLLRGNSVQSEVEVCPAQTHVRENDDRLISDRCTTISV